jgi:hypothetical protein
MCCLDFSFLRGLTPTPLFFSLLPLTPRPPFIFSKIMGCRRAYEKTWKSVARVLATNARMGVVVAEATHAGKYGDRLLVYGV